ncbi:MAG: hypothetical protein ACJ758_05410 [Actinomycetota bacterium]
MHAKRLTQLLGVVAVSAVTIVLPATVASAHAEFKDGPYTVAIGFGTEPAYVGNANSVEVIIHDTASGKGIDSAADTLDATIAFGSAQPKPVSMEENFDEDSGGSPGDYRGAFFPTQPGKYTIHVQGKIGKTPIDKTFTSSPTTFDTVQSPSTLEYPTRNPTLTELAGRIEAETPRLEAAASSAQDAANSAKTVGIIGIVVGLVALIVAVVAIATRPKRRST